MKRLFYIFFWIATVYSIDQSTVTISKELYAVQATPLLLVAQSDTQGVKEVIRHFSDCFDMTGKFSCKEVDRILKGFTRQDMVQFFNEGYALVLAFNEVPERRMLEWRLYDTSQGIMLKGKRYSIPTEGSWVVMGRTCAHHVWHVLTNSESSFLSKIIFTVKKKKGRFSYTSFYCADYDGTHQTRWKDFSTICINPHWYPSKEKPLIVYSEFTPHNVRLMGCDFDSHLFKICDREGTFVGTSWSNTQEMVYGRSGKIWNCVYNPDSQKWTHTLLIKEKEPCATPCVIDDGIVYCSGGKIKLYRRSQRVAEVITPEGYCVAPAYCATKKKLAYAKKVKGCMQLFMYDMRSKKHTQLTFDKGNKTDLSWSPCGTFIACCYNEGKTMQIGVLNCLTGKFTLVTSPELYCGYPAWSPAFDFYLNL